MKSLPRAARGRGTAKRWKGRLGRFVVFWRERGARDTSAPIGSRCSPLPPHWRGKLKERDGCTLKASNSLESRTRHKRPYRLTAFGTSPARRGKLKERDGRTLKASNSVESRTRHRRPYRLALLAASPILTGEAKRAGWGAVDGSSEMNFKREG